MSSVLAIYSEEDGAFVGLTTAGYLLLIAVLIGLLLLASYVFKPDQKNVLGTRKLVFSAMAIALATVTSMIELFHAPMGGSITLFSMLFVTLIGYWYGLGTGLLAAIAYGLIQLMIDPYIISVPQMLVDYIFAFGALGLSGVFHNAKKFGLIKGYLLGIIGRFFFATLSGVIFFGSYAGDYGMTPLAYSAAYNGFYIFIEGGITIVILFIPAVNKAMIKVKNLACQPSARDIRAAKA
ncbi:MAG: energy-coupled thiamine transporter ThiT [Eubacteriales bacterium]|jgi:thiamine transporter